MPQGPQINNFNSFNIGQMIYMSPAAVMPSQTATQTQKFGQSMQKMQINSARTTYDNH
jgi:hypothetical protein